MYQPCIKQEHIMEILVENIKIGSYIIIRDSICKVCNISYGGCGKHGNVKALFTTYDIFNNKKIKNIMPVKFFTKVPIITSSEYELIDIGECTYLLMNSLKEIIEINVTMNGYNENIYLKMKELFDADKCVMVTVSIICDEKIITDCNEKIDTDNSEHAPTNYDEPFA